MAPKNSPGDSDGVCDASPRGMNKIRLRIRKYKVIDGKTEYE